MFSLVQFCIFAVDFNIEHCSISPHVMIYVSELRGLTLKLKGKVKDWSSLNIDIYQYSIMTVCGVTRNQMLCELRRFGVTTEHKLENQLNNVE